MRSLPVFGLGIALALVGVGLFALTLRKPKPSGATEGAARPLKKSEVRDLETQKLARQTEATKLRIAGAVFAVAGAVLMVIS